MNLFRVTYSALFPDSLLAEGARVFPIAAPVPCRLL
jgi:hypothetical protein